ncbi:hypothetical protein BDK51DRAFT_48645 [Blyttiomyces helicus]|uniref:Uncharacterized protein n=1 Tax=Blyttiomyces helicus TaxID=388810 RepID=A0A4P9W138_9FUNG|nr:hypothetical protein BDK51DRAFT_48645 [Blyttiomyces helicus]|eukprot:RKO84853.1 hypothetical protein BDK51DRAFT_48645 [Blyttiomyces helicus]
MEAGQPMYTEVSRSTRFVNLQNSALHVALIMVNHGPPSPLKPAIHLTVRAVAPTLPRSTLTANKPAPRVPLAPSAGATVPPIDPEFHSILSSTYRCCICETLLPFPQPRVLVPPQLPRRVGDWELGRAGRLPVSPVYNGDFMFHHQRRETFLGITSQPLQAPSLAEIQIVEYKVMAPSHQETESWSLENGPPNDGNSGTAGMGDVNIGPESPLAGGRDIAAGDLLVYDRLSTPTHLVIPLQEKRMSNMRGQNASDYKSTA